MGFFDTPDVPPAPDMSGVINATKDISALSSELAQETQAWAQEAVATHQGNIAGYIDNITSDSQAARDMIQNFQDVADTQLGLSRGALDIKDTALANAAKASGFADVQADIQQQQLGEQQNQLGIQQKQLGMQDQFRQDQIAQQAHANALYQQYAQVYEPAQARFMADAEAYGTQDRINQARAGAAATVGEQFQGARDAATRKLESWGVSPSLRTGALDLGTRVKEAATKAAAMQAAQQAQEDRAFALRQAAIAQGQQLPGQATGAVQAATGIGANVNAAGNVANAAGQTAAQFGSLGNAAGQTAVGATNAATGATNAATGAQQAAIQGASGATQAQSGALAANTAAMGGEQVAGQLSNQALQTESNVVGTAPQYLAAANTANQGTTAAQRAAYQNQMDQFNAEKNNTSGFGQLLGTVAPIAVKAAMTGGTSLPFDLASTAAKSATSDVTDWDTSGGGNFNLSFAQEGGAIPATTSPSGGRRADDVPAQLTAGEFVMPRDVTSWYGEKFFQQLIQRAQNEKSKAQAKPAIGPGPAQPPAFVSRPDAAPTPAIPMGAR